MVYEADEIFDKIESSANFDPSTNTDTQMVEAATVDVSWSFTDHIKIIIQGWGLQ